jgi:hypothetical protein
VSSARPLKSIWKPLCSTPIASLLLEGCVQQLGTADAMLLSFIEAGLQGVRTMWTRIGSSGDRMLT